MEALAVDTKLARLIARSELDYMKAWFKAVEVQPGNPLGVETREFGNATALMAKSIPDSPLFNRVLNPDPGVTDAIEDILFFYHQNGIPCRVDVSPYHVSTDFLTKLDVSGLYQSRFHSMLYGALPLVPSVVPPGISIRKVLRRDLDLFAAVFIKAFGRSWGGTELTTQRIAESTRFLYGSPGWELYLAFHEETPAAIGMLYVQDMIASLAGGATIPVMRNKGCQSALIRKRIADAAALRSTLTVAQAVTGWKSHLNLQRAGVRTAYTKAVWTEKGTGHQCRVSSIEAQGSRGM